MFTELERDELAERLRWVRICKRTEKELDDFGILPLRKKKSFRAQGQTPDAALRYFDKCFCLGLDEFAPEIWFDNVSANVLFDLANFPLEMIFTRLKKEYDCYELAVWHEKSE